MAVVAVYALLRLGKDLSSLRHIRKSSYLIRRLGSVRVLLNDEIAVPFSYWVPGHSVVIIPSALMAKGRDHRIAIAHEIQHHRQADTKWVYAIWFLRVTCSLNPFAHLWNRWLSGIQEFACDETLVGRKKVEPQQYARCLVEVAETALNQSYYPACATGLVFLAERNLLKRRLEKMSIPQNSRSSRLATGAIAGAVFALMACTAFASQSLVQDRRVTVQEANVMAEKAKSDSGFPVVVNDLVLRELNRYIGTSEGRDFMRKSLQRMEGYRAMVEVKSQGYQLPLELMAVPITESGYQNLDPSQNTTWRAAGIWQFIASTARKYGLRVDDQVDERLNPELLTDAAMRYLKGNHLLFKDWLLAVMAYNMGEENLRKAIEATGSHDAWTLIRAGYENDKSYLARIMAAVLIMKNPDSVSR